MSPSTPEPEVWLRGRVSRIPPALQPVAHALLQAEEDAVRLVSALGPDELWRGPGAAAPVGFHLRHMAGSLDRLLTYARGEPLSDGQRAALSEEKEITPHVPAEVLLTEFREGVERAMEQLRNTPVEDLDLPRPVGRAGYPSSVRGLLSHAAEHTVRHAGQISTTLLALAEPD